MRQAVRCRRRAAARSSFEFAGDSTYMFAIGSQTQRKHISCLHFKFSCSSRSRTYTHMHACMHGSCRQMLNARALAIAIDLDLFEFEFTVACFGLCETNRVEYRTMMVLLLLRACRLVATSVACRHALARAARSACRLVLERTHPARRPSASPRQAAVDCRRPSSTTTPQLQLDVVAAA